MYNYQVFLTNKETKELLVKTYYTADGYCAEIQARKEFGKDYDIGEVKRVDPVEEQ